jgi:hypothetical protein
MGSLSVNDINELRNELSTNFDEIIYLNRENLSMMVSGEITVFEGVAPEGRLQNTLTFYSQENTIMICFCHSILRRIFKANVDSFIYSCTNRLKHN